MASKKQRHEGTRHEYSPIQTNGTVLTCTFFRNEDRQQHEYDDGCCKACHAMNKFFVLAANLDRIKARLNNLRLSVLATSDVAVVCCRVFWAYRRMLLKTLLVHGIPEINILSPAINYGMSVHGYFQTDYPELKDQEGVIIL